jgi:hypothetical protein
MIIELNTAEAALVAGALTRQELEQMYPMGEWVGSSFYPNGAPRIPNNIDPSL